MQELGIELSSGSGIYVDLESCELTQVGAIILIRAYINSFNSGSNYLLRTVNEDLYFLSLMCDNDENNLLKVEYQSSTEIWETNFECPLNKWFVIGFRQDLSETPSFNNINSFEMSFIAQGSDEWGDFSSQSVFTERGNYYSPGNIIIGENFNGIINSFEIRTQIVLSDMYDKEAIINCHDSCLENTLCIGIEAVQSGCTECPQNYFFNDIYGKGLGKCSFDPTNTLILFNSSTPYKNQGSSGLTSLIIEGDLSDPILHIGQNMTGDNIIKLQSTSIGIFDDSLSFEFLGYIDSDQPNSVYYFLESYEDMGIMDIYVDTDQILKLKWKPNDNGEIINTEYTIPKDVWIWLGVTIGNFDNARVDLDLLIEGEDDFKNHITSETSSQQVSFTIDESYFFKIGHNLKGTINRFEIISPIQTAAVSLVMECDDSCRENSFCIGTSKDDCLDCEDGKYIEDVSSGFKTIGTCTGTCHVLCKICFGGEVTECSECIDNALVSLTEASTCGCIDGYYYSKSDTICESCHGLCGTCTGPLISNCLSCVEIDNLVLSGTTCECGSGYILKDNLCVLNAGDEDDDDGWIIFFIIVLVLFCIFLIMMVWILVAKSERRPRTVYLIPVIPQDKEKEQLIQKDDKKLPITDKVAEKRKLKEQSKNKTAVNPIESELTLGQSSDEDHSGVFQVAAPLNAPGKSEGETVSKSSSSASSVDMTSSDRIIQDQEEGHYVGEKNLQKQMIVLESVNKASRKKEIQNVKHVSKKIQSNQKMSPQMKAHLAQSQTITEQSEDKEDDYEKELYENQVTSGNTKDIIYKYQKESQEASATQKDLMYKYQKEDLGNIYSGISSLQSNILVQEMHDQPSSSAAQFQKDSSDIQISEFRTNVQDKDIIHQQDILISKFEEEDMAKINKNKNNLKKKKNQIEKEKKQTQSLEEMERMKMLKKGIRNQQNYNYRYGAGEFDDAKEMERKDSFKKNEVILKSGEVITKIVDAPPSPSEDKMPIVHESKNQKVISQFSHEMQSQHEIKTIEVIQVIRQENPETPDKFENSFTYDIIPKSPDSISGKPLTSGIKKPQKLSPDPGANKL